MPASTTRATVPSPELAWMPTDACSLPTAERPLRVAEFDELFASSLRDVQRPADDGLRARLLLGGDDGLFARVQRLADRETACCSFFTFTVTAVDAAEAQPAETLIALDVEVPAAQAHVLDALVHRAVVAGRGRA
jgi:hypothetical protein